MIRLLEHCRVRQSVELESVPTVLHAPRGFSNRMLCGMADGRVILFKIGVPANGYTEEVLLTERDANAITAIDTYDLNGDGKPELIVGRRDGTVQVFSMPNEDNVFDTEIRQIYNEASDVSFSDSHGAIERVLFFRISMRAFLWCKAVVSAAPVTPKSLCVHILDVFLV